MYVKLQWLLISTFAEDLCLYIRGGCAVSLVQDWGRGLTVNNTFGTLGQALFPREDREDRKGSVVIRI